MALRRNVEKSSKEILDAVDIKEPEEKAIVDEIVGVYVNFRFNEAYSAYVLHHVSESLGVRDFDSWIEDLQKESPELSRSITVAGIYDAIGAAKKIVLGRKGIGKSSLVRRIPRPHKMRVKIGYEDPEERLDFENMNIVEETVRTNDFGKDVIRQHNAETGDVAFYIKIEALGLTLETSSSGTASLPPEDITQDELREAQLIALSRHLNELDDAAVDTLNYVKEKVGVSGDV